MLTLFGKRERFCDGISRRNFLQVGAVGALGMSMADLLRADAASTSGRRKSVINIYLAGGPSHLDMFDLKPEAPPEIRGEFHPVATNVPGMEICELMPRLAAQGDKFAVVRSLTGIRDEHNASQSDTGYDSRSLQSIGGRPGLGAVMSKVQGAVNGVVPTYVSLTGFGGYGFLGPVYGAYRPDGPGRENLRLNGQMTVDRLNSRRQLLSSLDQLRREVDQRGKMTAMDAFTERAMDVITSSQLAKALDLNREDPRIKDRYGIGQGGRRNENSRFLTARRLVEAGVRCVTLSWGGWDTHSNNFKTLGEQLPALDEGLATLIEDLDARGMLEDTIIMMSGEFGRTPRINNGAGRDHWAKAGFFFLAGGGFRTGQMIGTTNRLGEEAHDRPIHLQQVFATVYKQLGIDPDQVRLTDPNGRPQYLADIRTPIRELI